MTTKPFQMYVWTKKSKTPYKAGQALKAKALLKRLK